MSTDCGEVVPARRGWTVGPLNASISPLRSSGGSRWSPEPVCPSPAQVARSTSGCPARCWKAPTARRHSRGRSTLSGSSGGCYHGPSPAWACSWRPTSYSGAPLPLRISWHLLQHQRAGMPRLHAERKTLPDSLHSDAVRLPGHAMSSTVNMQLGRAMATWHTSAPCPLTMPCLAATDVCSVAASGTSGRSCRRSTPTAGRSSRAAARHSLRRAVTLCGSLDLAALTCIGLRSGRR